MTRRGVARGRIAASLVLAALIAATAASFSNDGVHVEAAGVEMTVKTSVEGGVQLFFAAS